MEPLFLPNLGNSPVCNAMGTPEKPTWWNPFRETFVANPLFQLLCRTPLGDPLVVNPLQQLPWSTLLWQQPWWTNVGTFQGLTLFHSPVRTPWSTSNGRPQCGNTLAEIRAVPPYGAPNMDHIRTNPRSTDWGTHLGEPLGRSPLGDIFG